MAGMCCGINVGETEPVSPVEPGVRTGHRKRIEIRKMISDISGDISDNQRLMKRSKTDDSSPPAEEMVQDCPKYGVTSVCGRRRDMEDSVSVIPDFLQGDSKNNSKKRKFNNQGTHFYGVFDGHGCSHVAKKCKERMHAIVKDEIKNREIKEEENWRETMGSSFIKMDREVGERVNVGGNGATTSTSNLCRCELQTPQCDAVGSTAVVSVVTPSQIVVSNCGDSRAVLCRGGVAIPLSSDHKPDRADELSRIEEAGGRVIYWDGPRVLGVLAMSRAIGDNYLKPYVIPDPEVTVTERSSEDECLILASDGLWDVVSNETAATVARMCLMNADKLPAAVVDGGDTDHSDKACTDASILLTKLALARRSTDNVSVLVVDLRTRFN